MITLPAPIPVTTPVLVTTFAIDPAPLAHVPPGIPSLLNTIVCPTQTMLPALTTSEVLAEHPLALVKRMTVVPGANAATIPVVALIVAIIGAEELHVPGPPALLKVSL
jgi:hypothetical protein